MHSRFLWTGFLCFCLFSVAASGQDEAEQENQAQQVFDSLFADKIQAARKSLAKTDDVKLAKELLVAAKESVQHEALLTLLSDASHDLGSNHPDGYETAIEALQLLIEHAPDRRDEAADRLLFLRRRQYSAARTAEAKKQIG
ncbi:MAG: hypothetical protein R3236_09715, partial [Phycisphaeraceae bacterium]|nr:hypothetical protein [Phycisphaeraceae bacterium]